MIVDGPIESHKAELGSNPISKSVRIANKINDFKLVVYRIENIIVKIQNNFSVLEDEKRSDSPVVLESILQLLDEGHLVIDEICVDLNNRIDELENLLF